jgi:TPP-dependent pyruvate/acetoin dehydrogenase alpha subunit
VTVIEAEVRTEVKEALEFARNSPFPLPEDAYQHMYANPFPIAH